MSFVQGFSQGFGLVDNAITKQQQLERQRMLDQRNEQRWQQRMDMQQDRFDAGQNWKAASFAQQQEANNYAREQSDRQFDLQQSQFDQNSKLSKLKIEEASLKIDSAKNTLKSNKAQKALRNIYSGIATKQDFNDLSKEAPGFLPQVVKRNDSYNKFANSYLSMANQYDQKIQQAQSPEQKEAMATQYVQELNNLLLTKEGRDTLNTAMYESLNARMKNDQDIEQISFGGVAPGPNGQYAVKMLIKTKDGKVKSAPATKNKTADGGDEVMLVPLSKIKGNVEQAVNISNQAKRYVQQNPALAKSFGLTEPKKDPVKLGRDDRLVDPETGKTIAGPSQESGWAKPMTQAQALSAARKLLEKSSPGAYGSSELHNPNSLPAADQKRYYALLHKSGLPMTEAEQRVLSGEVEPVQEEPNNGAERDAVGDALSKINMVQ